MGDRVLSIGDAPVGLPGRAIEMDAIREALERVAETGQVFTILGDPGVGKSALLAAVESEALQGEVIVLSSCGTEAETHLPFAALHRVLSPILHRADVLPPAQRAALAAAFGLSEAERPPEPLFIALAALELLADVGASTSILVIVDDLQWVDSASRNVIEFIARRLETERTVMLLAARTHHDVPSADLILDAIHLQGLDDATSHVVLRGHAPDLSVTQERRVLELAAGNPLALMELPTAIARAGGRPLGSDDALFPLTDRLERAYASRLDEFDRGLCRLLLVAALQGSDLVSESLEAAGELSDDAGSPPTFDAAVAAGLLTIDGATFRFRHPLVRSAIVRHATLDDRSAAHQALAQTLAADRDRATWHRSMAVTAPDEEVAVALEAGADRAMTRGATVLAEEWLERAAQLSGDQCGQGRRLLRAAELAFELGRAASVHALMARARALPLDQSDAARLAGLEGAFDDGVPGDVDHIRRLVHAAEQAAEADDQGLAAQLIIGASMTCYWGAADGPIVELVRHAAARLRVPRSDPSSLVVTALLDPLTRGLEVVDQLAAWAEQATAEPAVASALGRAGFVVGDFDRALLFARRASDGLRQQGRIALLAQTLVLETFSALYLGRWDVTNVAATEALRFTVETNQPVWAACARLGQANLAGLRGDRQRADSLASGVEQIGLMTGNRALLNGAQLVRGLAALGVEEPEQAFIQFRRMMDPMDLAHHLPQSVWAVDHFADAALLVGRVDDARAIIGSFESLVAGTSAMGVHRAMSLARALLAEDDTAEEHFAVARSHAAAGTPWVRARVDLAFGSWLRRRRRIIESRDVLRTAYVVFEALGAAAWSERAHRELLAAGQRSEPTERTGWPTLSAQELQIAQLAATGLSNREIGERLYLSHRTVGSHLYRVFPKLGVRSRAQLHHALSDE
jgi:DNA-binding CsgD family transcriptional regulator